MSPYLNPGLQNLVSRWYSVFLDPTDTQPQEKLQEEVTEFLEAESGTPHKLEEAADVLIVVMTQLTSEKFTVRQLEEALTDKLQVNLERKWKRNENGTISHVKA